MQMLKGVYDCVCKLFYFCSDDEDKEEMVNVEDEVEEEVMDMT